MKMHKKCYQTSCVFDMLMILKAIENRAEEPLLPQESKKASLSATKKDNIWLSFFLLRMRAGFSGSADLRLSGSHVLSEISDYTSYLIFTTLLFSKPTVGFFAKGLSECGISNR